MSIEPEQAVGAFTRFAAYFKINPVNTILSMMLLIMVATYGVTGYALYVNADKLFTRMFPTPQEETRYLHNAPEIANKINPLLERARTDTNSSKVIIALFHNGKRGITNVPWNFYSVRYAAKDDRIEYDIADSQDIPNTMNAELYARMWPDDGTSKCIAVDPKTIKSSMLRARVEQRNNLASYMCPIESSGGVPIGWVSFTFNVRNFPNKPAKFYLDYLGDLRNTLTPLLEDDLNT